MNNFVTYEKKQIEICEVDDMGEYQIYNLLNRFSQIATINAKEIGLWNEDMMNQYGWVVAKQTLHLNQPIHYNDRIELSTMIGNGSHVAFPRYYFIKRDGCEIGYCSSVWTLIDIHKRRIVSPKRIGLIVPQVDFAQNLDEPHTIDIDIPMKYITTRKVLYSDVDTNQHMNNSRYVQWALDLIDYQVHRHFLISDLTIHYKKEIRPLEDVELYLGYNQQRYIIEGRHDEMVAFTIEIIFNHR